MDLNRLLSDAGAALVLSGALVSSVQAGPIDKALVSADATWVAHLDVEAFSSSAMAKILLDAGLNPVAEAEAEIGIDLLQDTLGVTIYGSGDGPDDGTVLISATENFDAVLAGLAEEAEGYEQVTADGKTFDSWAIEDGRMYSFVQKIGEKRLIIAAENVEKVLAALKVVNGESSSLVAGGGTDGLDVSPSRSAWIYVSGNDLASLPIPPMGQGLVESMKSFALELGETESNAVAIALTVATTTAEGAAGLEGMLNMALMMVQGQDAADPEMNQAMKLLEGLKVTTDGAKLIVNLELDPALLVALAEEAGGAADDEKVLEDDM